MEVSLKHGGSRTIPAHSQQRISQPPQLRHATSQRKLHMMIKRTNDMRDDRWRANSSCRVAPLDLLPHHRNVCFAKLMMIVSIAAIVLSSTPPIRSYKGLPLKHITQCVKFGSHCPYSDINRHIF